VTWLRYDPPVGTLDAYALWAMTPEHTPFVVVGSLFALVAGVAAGFARARRRDAFAAAAEAGVGDEQPPLVEGRDVVLSGIVRLFEDHDVAVKVSITQDGTETKDKGIWSHRWTEVDREIVVAPFLLELTGGELVLVNPPNEVEVADALDQKVRINRNRRVLSAELVPGEHILARGRLERSDQAAPGDAYRDVQWGWALCASRGRMLLSSEPLGAGLRQRAAFHRRAAWTALALLVLTQGSLALFYARLAGRTETVTVTARHHKRGDFITVRGETFEVVRGDYERIREGTTIPIRYATEKNWDLGASATIRWHHGAIIVTAVIAFWIWYGLRRRSTRPWFRRKVNESGSGRLSGAG
jgi:hypothetical protein